MVMEHMPAPTSADSGASAADELSPRLDRLDALHSAWRVLAADDDDCAEIAETGRALSAYLTKIAESRSDVMPSALRNIDALLSEFEASIRQDALRRPISSLRSTLPRTLECDRRGLLDLLDVLIGDDPYGLSSIDERCCAPPERATRSATIP